MSGRSTGGAFTVCCASAPTASSDERDFPGGTGIKAVWLPWEPCRVTCATVPGPAGPPAGPTAGAGAGEGRDGSRTGGHPGGAIGCSSGGRDGLFDDRPDRVTLRVEEVQPKWV